MYIYLLRCQNKHILLRNRRVPHFNVFKIFHAIDSEKDLN